MFTGLVSAGRLVALEDRGASARLVVDAGAIATETHLGDSIAVNGCCLTVVETTSQRLAFDVIAETLRVTALGELIPGRKVNLERALRVGDLLGGHLVSGHIDGTGTIRRIESLAGETQLDVEVPPHLTLHMVHKGSIALDGISLTLASVSENEFRVALIPHTLAATNLGEARRGQRVNIETDLIGKHVEKLVEAYRGRVAAARP